MPRAEVIQGDCLAVLPTLESGSVDAVIADPPYELGFMGKGWDSSGIANSVDLWRAVLRVLKPGGHLLAFSGTRTYHRMTCAIEDAGFEVRDQMAWVYASGFPKSHNLHGDRQGWGTALKPAWEPICLARKPLIGTVAANVLSHGTGALNVDGCRVGTGDVLVRPSIERHNNAVLGKGLGAGTQTEPQGRWPANLMHDGSPEVLAGFPVTTSGSIKPHHVRTTSKTKHAFGERAAPPEETHSDTGSAARFFYCAKASKADRSEGNTHPTVKPTDLMRYLCRLVTPPGGIVLDPFTGSGSTGKAAVLEGFRFIGIEQEAEYVEIARARIAAVNSKTPLFAEVD